MAAEVELDEWSLDALPTRGRDEAVAEVNPNSPDRVLNDLRPAFDEIVRLLFRDTFSRYLHTVKGDEIHDNIKRLGAFVNQAERNKVQLFIKCFLSNPDSLASQHFLKYCEDEFNAENVLWCYHFKKMEKAVGKFKEFAKLFVEGYDTYLKLDAPRMVNISAQVRRGVDALWRRFPDFYKHY